MARAGGDDVVWAKPTAQQQQPTAQQQQTQFVVQLPDRGGSPPNAPFGGGRLPPPRRPTVSPGVSPSAQSHRQISPRRLSPAQRHAGDPRALERHSQRSALLNLVLAAPPHNVPLPTTATLPSRRSAPVTAAAARRTTSAVEVRRRSSALEEALASAKRTASAANRTQTAVVSRDGPVRRSSAATSRRPSSSVAESDATSLPPWQVVPQSAPESRRVSLVQPVPSQGNLSAPPPSTDARPVGRESSKGTDFGQVLLETLITKSELGIGPMDEGDMISLSTETDRRSVTTAPPAAGAPDSGAAEQTSSTTKEVRYTVGPLPRSVSSLVSHILSWGPALLSTSPESIFHRHRLRSQRHVPPLTTLLKPLVTVHVYN